MSAGPQNAELDARLAELSRQHKGIDSKDLMDVVQAILTTMEGDFTSVNVRFYSEIEALSSYISQAKAEIASLRPDEITDEHLPAATDELQAVVGATEQATNQIFEAVEAIEELASGLDEATAGKITEAVTNVYEACSFQDITGQRITKVVNALQHIEAKVEAMLEAFGSELTGAAQEKTRRNLTNKGPERPDEHLMNGPQMPESANSQDDIDALLASFD